MTSLAEQDKNHIVEIYTRYRADYLQRWDSMLYDWQHPVASRMVWMMYACNYLFTTAGLRWAVDPLRPNLLLRDLPHEVDTEPLQALALVLLTHNHTDHYDVPLLCRLARKPQGDVHFIVPEHLKDDFMHQVAPRPDRLFTAHSGQMLEFGGLRIEPFDSWHIATQPDGQRTGTDSTGYRISLDGLSWLFPGDVRIYDAGALKPFAPVDRLFAHLWLGRGYADQAEPPYLNAFCDFMLGSTPRAVSLGHLYEFSRYPNELWHQRHVALVRRRWAQLGVSIPIVTPFIGEATVL